MSYYVSSTTFKKYSKSGSTSWEISFVFLCRTVLFNAMPKADVTRAFGLWELYVNWLWFAFEIHYVQWNKLRIAPMTNKVYVRAN